MTDKSILPGSTIGILGGGQLGRMTAIEAKKMGYRIICLDPVPDSPCGQVADYQIIAPFDDLKAASQLAEQSDIVMYEFENIDARVVEELEKKFYLPQKSRILSIAQNRISEKHELQKAGFPVVPFQVVRNISDLKKGIADLGFPCILKTARGGYDGKGQLVIKNSGDLPGAFRILKGVSSEWVLEKEISFTHEISVIVARKQNGDKAVYPVVENIHRNNMLHLSIVPARVSSTVQQKAARIATEMAETFDLVGLLAIEFFVTPQEILVNEIAPRPHNSGHYSWDACYVSQFEQLVRVVCGLPLGSTQLQTPAVMMNILGADLPGILKRIPEFPDSIKIHLYGKWGKQEVGRKVGHLTVKTDLPEEAIILLQNLLPGRITASPITSSA